jgi:hypothetical protein
MNMKFPKLTLSLSISLLVTSYAQAAPTQKPPTTPPAETTASICGRVLPAEFILGYPGSRTSSMKSQWTTKTKTALAASLSNSFAKLCQQKLIRAKSFPEAQKIVFMENPNANVMSVWAVGKTRENTPGDYQWRPNRLYIEVPTMEQYSPKALDPEMRRAILCSENQNRAIKEGDETACLAD